MRPETSTPRPGERRGARDRTYRIRPAHDTAPCRRRTTVGTCPTCRRWHALARAMEAFSRGVPR